MRLPGVLLLGAGVLGSMPLPAVEGIAIEMAVLEGEGWRVRQPRLDIHLGDPDRMDVRIAAAGIERAAGETVLGPLALACDDLDLAPHGARCEQATLHASRGEARSLAVPLGLAVHRDARAVTAQVTQARLGTGELDLEVVLGVGDWRLEVDGEGIDPRTLIDAAGILGIAVPPLTIDGRVDLAGHAGGAGVGFDQATVRLRGSALTASNPTDTLALEGAAGVLEVAARRTGETVAGRVTLRATAGQYYIDPVYVEVEKTPLVAEAEVTWDRKRLVLAPFRYRHGDVISLMGRASFLRNPALRPVAISLDQGQLALPAAYGIYLQPLLIGTGLDELETEGRIAVSGAIEGDALRQLEGRTEDVSLVDRRGRFAIRRLDGTVAWDPTRPTRSAIGWDGGRLFAFELGAARAQLIGRGDGLSLAHPLELPVLDGELVIEGFELHGLGTPGLHWRLEGYLEPISMAALTDALDWPPMDGKLSGVIPTVTYDGETIDVEGILEVRAFDGQLTIENLVIEDPFGVVPRLRADVELEHLDLDALTRTFSFGKIQGGLAGYVRDLRLESWRPVAFDARLETPEDDTLPHRISQRAVENLSSVGGGGLGGALSRGVMGLIDTFGYRRAGIGCTLEQGVCTMSGLEPREGGGFYIVRGGVLPPRVDVIGYERRVDWETLVERLRNIRLENARMDGVPSIQ